MSDSAIATQEYVWHPPSYNVLKLPSLEESCMLSVDPELPENFARSCKWSPDGSTLLTQCENRTFQFVSAPPIADASGPTVFQQRAAHPIRTLNQPSPILDFLWYPTASQIDPASYCFLASVRECPVKLLDASDGRLRASYRIVDHRERQIAPHSLAFNPTAVKIYCGFENAIEVFDVLRPGEGTRLLTTPSKKSKDGLIGIISSLSFSPSYDSEGFYAAGSLSPTPSNIAMFSELQGETPVMFVGGGPSAGVTQLHFNPMQPHILYASYRRHGSIYSWDLRSDVSTPLQVFKPRLSPVTNQKMKFDVDISGKLLASGDQYGHISVFDLLSIMDENGDEISPVLEYEAHKDSIGSVSFNPIQPLLASTSGSRHFLPRVDSDSESDDESDSERDDETEGQIGDITGSTTPPGITRMKKRPHPVTVDSSIKFWNFKSESTST